MVLNSKQYDIIIVGGGIAGSIAARYTAENKLETLLVESARTPREKPCSAIQFKYFQKLIGKRIPKDKLCTNTLNRLYIEWPNGKSFNFPFKMLNFTRDVFDSWLNSVAIEAGAEFRDAVRCTGFEKVSDGFIVSLHPKHSEIEKVRTKYLIAADGLASKIRHILRPQDYLKKAPSGTLNYYINADDDGELDPHTLYQFWNLNFSNLMFAWTYKKNDLWVIGTGYTENIKEHCDTLLEYVKNKFNFEGKIVKKEGYASRFRLHDPKHTFLGEDNLLMMGDAAGLVDVYRGLGMDAAALSARRAAKAIIKAEKCIIPAMKIYKKSMRKLEKKIEKNGERQLIHIQTNDDLLKYLKKSYLKTGIGTLFGSLINKFLPSNRVRLLPL